VGAAVKARGAKARAVAVVMAAAAATTATAVVATNSRAADARLPRPLVLGSTTPGSAHGLPRAASGLLSSSSGCHQHYVRNRMLVSLRGGGGELGN
jgi:hypothetical protein